MSSHRQRQGLAMMDAGSCDDGCQGVPLRPSPHALNPGTVYHVELGLAGKFRQVGSPFGANCSSSQWHLNAAVKRCRGWLTCCGLAATVCLIATARCRLSPACCDARTYHIRLRTLSHPCRLWSLNHLSKPTSVNYNCCPGKVAVLTNAK